MSSSITRIAPGCYKSDYNHLQKPVTLKRFIENTGDQLNLNNNKPGNDLSFNGVFPRALGKFSAAGLVLAACLGASSPKEPYQNLKNKADVVLLVNKQDPIEVGNFASKHGKIYDPKGKEYIAHGFNIPGPSYWDIRDMTIDVDDIVNNWHANMVRMNARSIANDGQAGSNQNYEEVIEKFTQKGVVVVIEDHITTGKYLNQEELKKSIEFYKKLAEKYKDNPYVWFDTGNEPGSSPGILTMTLGVEPKEDEAKWLSQQREIIKAIRSVNSSCMIMVEDNFWGNGYEGRQSSILKYGKQLKKEFGDNLVFSVHLYQNWTKERLHNLFKKCKDMGHAIIIGEFGVFNNEYLPMETLKMYLQEAKEHGNGALAWKWFGAELDKPIEQSGDRNCLKQEGNGGGWQKGSLTEFGQLVWDFFKSIKQ